MIKLKYIFTSALLVAAASASQAVSRQQMQTQIDKDAPAYTIQGKDSICQIFIYSPAPNQGLHLAYFTDDERWVDVGQLCASDYGPWGAEKKMYNPFVVKSQRRHMARTLEREPACAAVCRSLFRRPHHLAPAGLSHHPRKRREGCGCLSDG